MTAPRYSVALCAPYKSGCFHQSKPKTNHYQVEVVLVFSFLISPYSFQSVKKTLPIPNKELIQNGVKTQSLPHREYGRIAKRFSGDRPFPCALSSALFRCYYGGCLNGEAQPSRSFIQAPAIVPQDFLRMIHICFFCFKKCYNYIIYLYTILFYTEQRQ